MNLHRHYAQFLNTIPDGAMVVSEKGIIELANNSATRMFGYAADGLNGQSLDVIIPESMRMSHVHHVRRFFTNPSPRPMGQGLRFLGLRKDQTHFPVDITISPLELDNECLAVAIVRDNSERTKTEQKIRMQLEHERSRALTDDLTGLANRRAFMKAVEETVEKIAYRGKRRNKPFALAYIDLDNFKHVNDSEGHAAGDALLQHIAQALQSASRSCDLLARIGGDEFALVLYDVEEAMALSIIDRLYRTVNKTLAAQKVNVSLSIGWAHSHQFEQLTYRDIIHAADEAMYRAKQSGKNGVVKFEK
ncbi:sensor domain-containing diguanylate cyclase [Aliidiomarina celeris]|uniref:sensor domain-containing diguanylate cyclase n=1 Tax=Aliidiomarina celeris TaxID=2249428 RepID=UPI000DE8B111|nr:sensor domain-containing diguanylate cyclase [Aliidiomarina celeris]